MQSTMYVRSASRNYRLAKPAEILQAASQIEFTRIERNELVLRGPQAAMFFFARALRHLPYEAFVCVFMNSGFESIGAEKMFRGSAEHSMISIREVVREALERNATVIVVAHNHPTGDAIPSDADLRTTQALVNALAYFDVRMLDHVIIAGEDAYSFSMNGDLPNPNI